MAWKHRSGYYYTELVLRGYGKLRRMSLRTTRKADAEALEKAIKEVARRAIYEPRLHKLIDAIQGRGRGAGGELTPEDLLVAIRAPEGPDAALHALVRRLDDPPLADVVKEYLETAASVTREDRHAMPIILKYAGPRARLSDLTDPSTIEQLLRAIETGTGKQRNSVVRYEKRSLSKLLTWRYGRAERNRIMADVRYASTDDRRRIREHIVTPAAIGRLLDALRAGIIHEGDEQALLYTRIAITTGAEVSAIARALNADWHPESRALHLRGTKRIKRGQSRDRAVRVLPSLAGEIDRRHRADEPKAGLFDLRHTRYITMFEAARKRAKLTEAVLSGSGKPVPLRPHDLRRVFGALAEQVGATRTAISAGLGHTDLAMTDRYLHRETALTEDQTEAIARELGW